MPRPLAVLQRVYVPSPPTLEEDPDPDAMQHSHSDERDAGEDESILVAAAMTTYAIPALIRKKITFSKRPTPIVGLSAKT